MNSTCWECLFYTSIFCNVAIHIPHEEKTNPVRLKYSDKMLLAPMWGFCPKYGPGKSYFLSRLRQWQSPVITNKHWTLLYFQKKTLEIIMKLVGPEITITSNFTEIRKQSLDNYFETRLMKRCDVTTFPLKKMKNKMWGRAQCLGENWPFISASPHGPQSLASVEPNDTSSAMRQRDPFIHTGILVPPKPVPVGTSLYVQWKCNEKCSPQGVWLLSPQNCMWSTISSLVPPTFHLPLLIPPAPSPSPVPNTPPPIPLVSGEDCRNAQLQGWLI